MTKARKDGAQRCTSMIQRFVLSRFLVVLDVRGCVRKLTSTTFDIRFHFVDRLSLRFVRVRVEGGGGEVHQRGLFSAVFFIVLNVQDCVRKLTSATLRIRFYLVNRFGFHVVGDV